MSEDYTESYLKEFADREDLSSRMICNDSRLRILASAGIRVNSNADVLCRPGLILTPLTIRLSKIKLSSMNKDLDKIIIDKCKCNIDTFKILVSSDESVKKIFLNRLEHVDMSLPILVRKDIDTDKYLVLDGMHRVIKAVIDNHKNIQIALAENISDSLPICEAHIVYDLIRAYKNRARDNDGVRCLKSALELLMRTYGNVEELINTTFKRSWIFDKDLSGVIDTVLESNRMPASIDSVLDHLGIERNQSSGNQCYEIMRSVAMAFQASKVLEIGTNYGGSAVIFCKAILNNRKIPEIHTVDNWASGTERKQQAYNNFKKACVEKYVVMHEGDSKEIVPKIFNEIGKVDLVFIDGDHNEDVILIDYNNCKDHTDLILFHDTDLGDMNYLRIIENEGWKVLSFPTRHVECNDRVIGISLAQKIKHV